MFEASFKPIPFPPPHASERSEDTAQTAEAPTSISDQVEFRRRANSTSPAAFPKQCMERSCRRAQAPSRPADTETYGGYTTVLYTVGMFSKYTT